MGKAFRFPRNSVFHFPFSVFFPETEIVLMASIIFLMRIFPEKFRGNSVQICTIRDYSGSDIQIFEIRRDSYTEILGLGYP